MDIWPRRFVIGVPLFVLDLKRSTELPHHGMRGIFHPYRSGCKRTYVTCEPDAAHERVKPSPHGISVKFTQQRCVMKADPASPALFDVALKCSSRGRLPAVWWIVQLDKQPVLR